MKADGTMKYRLIQDQRINMVNSAVAMPERQVLPRPIDHAPDLALLIEDLRSDEVLTTLVLDFKDAFMSVPLHPDERRFNCARVEEPGQRGRAALIADETEKGKFIVWQVLGFWGAPQPPHLFTRSVLCDEVSAGASWFPLTQDTNTYAEPREGPTLRRRPRLGLCWPRAG